MSNQDYDGLDDLWTAINKAATSGHPGPNDGRIFDGCIFVTAKEWAAISDEIESRSCSWGDMTAAQRLSARPIRIIANGGAEKLSDGRILMAFADTLYLLPEEPEFTHPPLPRLRIGGHYVLPRDDKQ